jgi:HEAT repeat protein
VALGSLGTAANVPVLAGKAAAGSPPEKRAARQALVRLHGDDVNAALVAAMDGAGPEVRVEALAALAARNAKDALPTVLKSVEDGDAAVRLAALRAVRFLADENNTAAIVGILKAAGNDAERRQAELALLGACTRGREACAGPIVAGLADAAVPARIALLHALARSGGAAALEAVAARLQDDDEAVRDEAVRMLSIWRDPAVKPHLLAIAEQDPSERHQTLAVRGLVRLARPHDDAPADLDLLKQAMGLAKRPQEKRLVVGVLGGVATLESLALATAALDDAAVAEEAGLAAVMIAEKMKDAGKDEVRASMEKVEKVVKSPPVRARAQKVLESL